MATQLITSLIILPVIWKLKYQYTIYESKLSDGQDIAIFMLCTFFLLLAPVIAPILIIAAICETVKLLRIRNDWLTDKSNQRITEKYRAKYW